MPHWEQGQHVALIGSTGTGKTTLLEQLASRRKYCVVLLTKSDTLAWRRFRRITTVRQMDTAQPFPDGAVRLILYPGAHEREQVFRAAIKKAYSQGGWTIAFDELYELQLLGLEKEVIQLYSEGRSERVTCIGGMQRPSWVTHNGVQRWAISQPTHIFQFQTRDERDLKVTQDILGKQWVQFLAGLKQFEFAYLNQVSGKRARGTVRTLEEVF